MVLSSLSSLCPFVPLVQTPNHSRCDPLAKSSSRCLTRLPTLCASQRATGAARLHRSGHHHSQKRKRVVGVEVYRYTKSPSIACQSDQTVRQRSAPVSLAPPLFVTRFWPVPRLPICFQFASATTRRSPRSYDPRAAAEARCSCRICHRFIRDRSIIGLDPVRRSASDRLAYAR